MDKRGNISSRNMRLFAAIITLIEALILTSLAGCPVFWVRNLVTTAITALKIASIMYGL